MCLKTPLLFQFLPFSGQNSADNNKLIFSYFSKKIGFDISCKFNVFLEDNLHEISKPISKCHLLNFYPACLALMLLTLAMLTMIFSRQQICNISFYY